MNELRKKLIALTLALCMVIGLCPVALVGQAEAANLTGGTSLETATTVPIGEEVATTFDEVGTEYYFAIPDVPAGSDIYVISAAATHGNLELYLHSETDKDAETFKISSGIRAQSRQGGTYYLTLKPCWWEALNVEFTVNIYENDANEPNDTMATATPIAEGDTVDFILTPGDSDYFKVTTQKAGEILQVEFPDNDDIYLNFFNSSGGSWSYTSSTADGKCTCRCSTGEAGDYYIEFYCNYRVAPITSSFTLAYYRNDANEPNNTRVTATELRHGETVDFTVEYFGNGYYDNDYFRVVTDKPGQDIAVTISGYDYTNQGERLYLCYEPADDIYATNCGSATISGDTTLYLHAAEAGEHYFMLKCIDNYDSSIISRSLTVEVLDGDKNEPNDTVDTATPLTIGVDETFMVGGYGDEDWFTFEAAPADGETELYTLSFLDLNTDYSDNFYYDLYAPDGSAVSVGTAVNIRHVRTIGCDQQGLYKVRVYTVAGLQSNTSSDYNYSDSSTNYKTMDYSRSTLRIRVEEGGDDPYENNDTWLTAAQINAGDTLTHVLPTTTDEDWFCLAVPEGDMILHLTSSKTVSMQLYSADYLMEYGYEFNGYRNGYLLYDSRDAFYYKLTDPGLYYIRLTAYTASSDVLSTTVELLPATAEENNDTWQKATRLYEGVPQDFAISAYNDKDWFKIVVEEDGASLNFTVTDTDLNIRYALYRETDFLANGDNAAAVTEFKNASTVSLDRGTYYLKCYYYWSSVSYRADNLQISYSILPADEHNSLETAHAIPEGEWCSFRGEANKYTYFSLGELKSGDQVRVSLDSNGSSSDLYLLDAQGNTVSSTRYCGGYTFSISTDGVYYLKAYTNSYDTDKNGDQLFQRIRYDIGGGDETVSSIEAPESITLVKGEKVYLDLRLAPYDGTSRNNNSCFSVSTYNAACVSYSDYSGYLTANSVGTGTIIVIGNNSITREIPVTVVEADAVPATAVTIQGAPATLAQGSCAYLTADIAPDDVTESAVWTSSDTGVLYVAQGGRVTAVGQGTATITVTVGSVSDSVTIATTGEAPTESAITGLTLDQYKLTLYMGEDGAQLTATVKPTGVDADVKWSSSAPGVATVSASGFVTPIAPGTSVITAAAGDRRVSCVVTVMPQRVRVTGVTLDVAELELPMDGSTTLTATIAPVDATTRTLLWTSDDESIAEVSRTGIVKALRVGETVIRVTTVDGGFTAAVKVTVTAKAQLGDVNRDGAIDAADAMLCLRAAVGLVELTKEQIAAADVNHDGFVDAGDAIRILRYDAGLIESLE